MGSTPSKFSPDAMIVDLCRVILATSLLTSGCASSHKPEPSVLASTVTDSRSASELVARGREAAVRGDAVRAEQYLSLAIDQGADRRQVMPLLLDACLKSSHLRAALNHAQPYLLEHPEDDALRYLVAAVHMGLGQLVQARRELGLLLQSSSSNADAHYLLGIIESASNIDAARSHFRAVLEYSKDETQKIEVESRLAELRLRERELDEHSARFSPTPGDEP